MDQLDDSRQAGVFSQVKITPQMGAEFFRLVADVLQVDPPMYQPQQTGEILLARARLFLIGAQDRDKHLLGP